MHLKNNFLLERTLNSLVITSPNIDFRRLVTIHRNLYPYLTIPEYMLAWTPTHFFTCSTTSKAHINNTLLRNPSKIRVGASINSIKLGFNATRSLKLSPRSLSRELTGSSIMRARGRFHNSKSITFSSSTIPSPSPPIPNYSA